MSGYDVAATRQREIASNDGVGSVAASANGRGGDDDRPARRTSDDDDASVSEQIARARRLLDDARRKQTARMETSASSAIASAPSRDRPTGSGARTLPFFAARAPSSSKIKSKTSSGDIIADGETMANISLNERWEVRSLSEMFQRESRTDYDGRDVEMDMVQGATLADRDVNRSIYNLRKSMRNEDFMRVFDSRNRFIGDLD